MEKVAGILRQNSEQIISLWETRVRENIKASRMNTKIALYDHLPIILEDLASIFEDFKTLDNPYEDLRYKKIVESSVEHGRHRATTAEYTLEGLINEYIFFHKVITQVLREKGVKQLDAYDLIKYSIETAILKSVDSFSHSIAEMQQKLTGTLAHDIRNPLSTSRLSLEMMGKDIDEKRLEKFRVMSLNGINKSLGLVEELLDMITIKAGQGMNFNFEEIDIVNEISNVFLEAKEIYSVALTLEVPDHQVLGIFDAVSIRRLLENLITNAIKYGDTHQPISIKFEDKDNSVRLSVHNYGNPIHPDKKREIFNFLDRGNQHKAGQHKSWGIGLTLVKMVADAYGGHIDIKSNVEEGTVFMITLRKDSHRSGKVKTRLTQNV